MNNLIKTSLRNASVGVPLLFQSAFFNVMFYLDSFLLGFIGEHEVAAASAGSQVIWLYEALIACPAYVCGTIVGRLEGAGRSAEIRTTVLRCFTITGILSLTVGSALFAASRAISLAMIHDSHIADMMSIYVKWATFAYAISTFGTVAEYTLQNMKRQKQVLLIYVCEFMVKLFVSIVLLFFLHCGLYAVISGIVVSKITRALVLFCALARSLPKTVASNGLGYEYSWKSYIKQCIPLAFSVLIWNISTIIISAGFGKLDVSSYATYAVLNNSVYIVLIPTEAYTKSLAILVARLTGASSRLSPEYIRGRLHTMQSATVLIGLASACISYMYIVAMPAMQPGISIGVWREVHTIIVPFLGYILCKSITDSVTEGFLRPIFDNAFILLVEIIALPCTVIFFSVMNISLHSGFWYLFSLELLRLFFVCFREAVQIRRGLPSNIEGGIRV